MIPIGLMVIGALISLISGIQFIRVLCSPIYVKWGNIFGKVELSDEGAVKRKRKRDRRYLRIVTLTSFFIGAVIFVIGWAIGFNVKGEGFWFNHFISGESIKTEKWDRLTENGSFISDNGNEYPYYLLVNGNTYEFCGEVCENAEDIKTKLSKIKRENTVIIIDSYAVSSKIKEAESILTEMGINYEMEEV